MALTEKARQELRAIRRAMNTASVAVAASGDANVVILSKEIFQPWTPGDYRQLVGQARLYGGYPYKVYQPHDSTHTPDWTPDGAPSLWVPYHGTTPETALPYRQPTGAHDTYKIGEHMIWTDGTVHRTVRDTAYSPEAYAADWALVG